MSIIHFDSCSADLHLEQLIFPDRVEALSLREVRLLRRLSAHPGPIPKQLLASDGDASRTITNTIRRLRVRIEPAPSDPVHIRTAFGVGYHLTPRHPQNTNLPAEHDPYCGHRALLRRLLGRSARLRVLVGCGGLGKTRFARRLGAMQLCRFPGGVWFADLSSATDRDSLRIAVRAALPAASPRQPLGGLLAERGRALLILDNAEQVHAPLCDLLPAWSAQAPAAHFLVTSRRVPGLRGVAVTELPPLSAEDAAALFCARSGQPAGEGLPALLAALDGHPLSIELMAARSQLLSPRDMLARLTDQARLRSLPRRGVPDHQRTLQATMAWSWELLAPPEQAALAALSTFRGGFTVSAAEAVLGTDAAPLLEVLRAHSLLHHVRPGRWSMYALIRAFADGQLSAGARQAAEQRHGAFFAAHGGDDDLDNLLIATRRAMSRGDASIAGATGLAAVTTLAHRGPLGEGLSLISALLAMPLSTGARLQLALLRAQLLLDAGEAASARAVLEQASGLGDTPAQRAALCLAWGTLEQGLGNTAPAHEYLQQARAGFAAVGDRLREAEAHAALAGLEGDRGDLAAAAAHDAVALAVFREQGAQRRLAQVLTGAAYRDARAGHSDRAEERFQQALDTYHQLGDALAATYTIAKRANLRYQQGDLVAAAADYEEVLSRYRRLGHRRFEAVELGNFARVYRLRGDRKTARRLSEEALALHRRLGDQRAAGVVLNSLGSLSLLDGALDEARALFEEALVAQRAAEDRSTEGITLGNLALLFEQQAQPEEARRCYGAALALHRQSSSRANEGITLGNLGGLELGVGQLAEARAHLEDAIAVLAPLGHPARGAFSGMLAEALARSGLPGAEALLSEGEHILAAIPDELGLLRCHRAAIALHCGDPPAARAALDAARRCSPAPGSRLDRRITDLQRSLEAAG